MLRTGAAFLLFGTISVALAAVVIPVARRLSRDLPPDLRAQRVIHRGYCLFIGYLVKAGVMTLRTEGADRLKGEGAVLVVANHPTLIDMCVLGSIMPQVDCIVNVKRAENPTLRGAVTAAGYVRNDGGAAVVNECAARLRAGRTVLVFPEGTRSPRSGLGPFKRGAAHVALRSGHEILPVLITCDPPTLLKGQKWYDVPDRSFQVTVRTLDPISPKPYASSGDSAGLAARKLTAELREAFLKRMESG